MNATTNSLLLGACLVALGVSGSAAAQVADSAPPASPPISTAGGDAPPPAAADAPKAPQEQAESTNGDIIVTAQRRSESLQRTPVAVAV